MSVKGIVEEQYPSWDTAGASLHLVAVATAVSPTDYQFSKVN
jgi:hypothetical protein